MSELKRNITTIAEQDEHQVLNQPAAAVVSASASPASTALTTSRTSTASASTVCATTCESIYLPQSNCTLLQEPNSPNHNNLSSEASHLLFSPFPLPPPPPPSSSSSCQSSNSTPSIDGCNIRRQFDSTATTLFKESSNSIQLAKEVTRGKKKKLTRIKESQSSASTSSSIEYKRIDEEDLETSVKPSQNSSHKSTSVALLVTMILIYYSLLFLLLFKFHSTLGVPDDSILPVSSSSSSSPTSNDTLDDAADSSVKHESPSTGPIDPMSMSMGLQHSINHPSAGDTGSSFSSSSFSSSSSSSSLPSLLSSDDDSFGTNSLFDRLQEDKHLKKNSIQLGLVRDSSDDGQGDSVVQISDSLTLDGDDHLALGKVNSRYFDISLDEPNDQLHLYWLPDYKHRQLMLQVQFRERRKFDWFAIGFSNYGNITNADLCILWPDHKGQFHFEDAWTDEEGFVVVESDGKNNCKFIRLTKSSSDTLNLLFTRKFDTCDGHDYIIEDGTTHVVYATGRGPVKRVDGLKILHSSSPELAIKFGFVRTRLLRPIIQQQESSLASSPSSTLLSSSSSPGAGAASASSSSFTPSASFSGANSVEVVDIATNGTLVPAKETTYWCSMHKIPPNLVAYKHHVIGYEAIINGHMSKSLVHHMEIFHCESRADLDLPNYSGECIDSKKPRGLEACSKVLAAWAMGANGIIYPKEAGLPIGGSSFSPYVMLEIHYNNPHTISNAIDSSGIRFLISPHLRQFDVGILELGLEYSDKNSIPPKQPNFSLTGYCVSECTRIGLPKSGIKVIASQLHTHLTGKRVVTKHIRNGIELTELNRDDHYSQEFQEIRLLHQPVTVLPGDSLITTCTYDTSNRINMTLGGFAISDEMCVNYIHYYPKVNLEVCKSSIDDRFLKKFFQYMNIYEGQETSVKTKGYAENFNSIHWSVNSVKKLNSLYLNSPLSMQCNQSNGQRFNGDWTGIQVTKVYSKLKKHPSQCTQKSDVD